MGCIYCHCPLFPIHSELKHKQNLQRANKLLWLSTNEPISLLPQRQNALSPSPLRTKAVASSLLLVATAQAKPPDLNVLLLTGSGFLFLYWITNFVVPDIVLKDFQVDKSGEDQRDIDYNLLQDKEKSTSTTSTPLKSASQGRKKKGFRSTES
ncbi:hypothetical protein LguiA_023316 [Lonicera macranthoides]